MQAPRQEFVGSNDQSPQTLIIKGKRTKRQRPSSPFAVTLTSSSSTASIGGGVVEEYNSISSSPTTSGEIYESTEEEEDMANCLIMLAQSDGPKSGIDEGKFKVGKMGCRKLSEITTTTNKAGFYVYECKTCNRSFPSFQALGGHRASHKKPKTGGCGGGGASPLAEDHHHIDQEPLSESPVLALQVSNHKACQGSKSNKIHECSICGSEFTSGQALGGHMRRHRAAATATTKNDTSNGDDIKPRNILSLDLNLPAPEDDLRESKFQFGAAKQAIVFSTPALVDCHY
ncbi:hypothetical protein like AT2G28200 [Hibiscus trionum]|uniref:C2H2-type domain-containing protein n=1 Tax=Hibiscus trionum TaxID=183268 RepID=A0A9W7M838_HIBTR|nr:hypothetical protein like AT2G28200 [Hibiscus trionum]